MKLFRAPTDPHGPATDAGPEQDLTLTDELLDVGPHPTDQHGDEAVVDPRRPVDPTSERPGADDAPDESPDGWADPDEEVYEDLAQRRPSWLTRVLLSVLLLALGVLAGVHLDSALAPAPRPQVVYVLGDPGPGASTPEPTPSGR